MCKTSNKNLVEDPENILKKKCVSLVTKIIEDVTHPLHPYITTLPHGRLRMPKCRTDRFYKSFMPYAIKLFNSRK